MEAKPANTDVSAGCTGCAERERRIAELEARLKQLEHRLEEVLRAGKRQAAPFSRGLPKVDPKTPGRKAGDDYGTKARRAVPPVIDEVYAAPLPSRCPHCGGRAFIDSRVAQQYQTEIPRRPIHRQFNVAVAHCTCCGKRVQGRHPLQTSDALGCCASQLGPEAQAAVVLLNKELGLSQGKISRCFAALFGIQLSRGGSCQVMLRAADRCEGNYHAIVKRVQESPSIVPDETGWRIGGWLAWLHVAVGNDAVAYLVARERGFKVSVQLIGENYRGTLIHDAWVCYMQFLLALHQMCLGHLLRRCHELLETATGGAVLFPRKVKAVLQEALAVRDERDAGEISLRAARAQADVLDARMEAMLKRTKYNAANERFAKHLWKYRGQLFPFLRHRGIDATNHRAEQAIRPAVVNRKVWGGNRTEAGAVAQSVLMSVLFTAQKLKRDALEFVSRVLRSRPNQAPMLIQASG